MTGAQSRRNQRAREARLVHAGNPTKEDRALGGSKIACAVADLAALLDDSDYDRLRQKYGDRVAELDELEIATRGSGLREIRR